MFLNVDYKKIQSPGDIFSPCKSLLEESFQTRVCSQDKADFLREMDYGAMDFHVHTWFSHDVLPIDAADPLVIYKRARQKGMRFITFTDHDTMDAYDRVGWTREGIVPGVEIKILDPKRVGHTVHINVYDLNRTQFNELEEIAGVDRNIERFVQYLREHDLCYVYNHPFWHEPGEIPSIQNIIDISELFPVVEYNMGRVKSLNTQAMNLAALNDTGLVAGTDTHIGLVGNVYSLARGNTFRQYFDNIKRGRSFIVPGDMTAQRLMHEVNERIKYLFERDTWQFNKSSYDLETGISLVDSLVEFMVRSDAGSFVTLKRIAKGVLEAVNRSGIPANLYIKSQCALAEKIEGMMRARSQTVSLSPAFN